MKYAIALTVAFVAGTTALAWPDPSGNAWDTTRAAVLDKIKTPATADFCAEPSIERVGEGVYAVAGYVDCENLYGATVREKFEAIVVNNKVDTLHWGSSRDTFERVRQALEK